MVVAWNCNQLAAAPSEPAGDPVPLLLAATRLPEAQARRLRARPLTGLEHGPRRFRGRRYWRRPSRRLPGPPLRLRRCLTLLNVVLDVLGLCLVLAFLRLLGRESLGNAGERRARKRS